MPSTSNDGAAFDPVDYYTRQLPLELARLTEVRDELRQRQGAMGAVEEAHNDRQAAAAELQAAKDQAAALVADAKAADAKSKAKAAQLADRADRDQYQQLGWRAVDRLWPAGAGIVRAYLRTGRQRAHRRPDLGTVDPAGGDRGHA